MKTRFEQRSALESQASSQSVLLGRVASQPLNTVRQGASSVSQLKCIHSPTVRTSQPTTTRATHIPPALAFRTLPEPLLPLLRLDPLRCHLLPFPSFPRRPSLRPQRWSLVRRFPPVALVVRALVRKLGFVEVEEDEGEGDEALLGCAADSAVARRGWMGQSRARVGKVGGGRAGLTG